MKRVLQMPSAVLVTLALMATLGLKLSSAASEAANPAAQQNSATASEVEISMTPRVTMSTSVGDIVLELDRAKAPESVANFLAYVESGFYDGTIFHRVIDGFMIQGGGFTSDFQKKKTRPPIRNEANNGLKNHRYTIAMARTNAPHSGTAQFFINTVDNRALDHTAATQRGWGYAVFGRVVEGTEVVDSISSVLTGAGGPFSRDAPQTQIVISTATLARIAAAADAETSSGSAEKPAGEQTPATKTE